MKRTTVYFCLISLCLHCTFAAADYVEKQTVLNNSTESPLQSAESWGLDTNEWSQYQTLVTGVRRHLSAENISPIEVLGIHATSDIERKRYARMWAKVVLEDTRRILAFQHAFDEAIRVLTQNEPLIDISRLTEKADLSESLASADRLFLFVEVTCEMCGEIIDSISPLLSSTTSLNIYFLDPTGNLNDSLIREWAITQELKPEQIRNHLITLNRDAGLLKKLFPRVKQVPVLARVQQNRFEIVDLAKLF